ncbi:MAG: lipopolysaccharide transport system permease protein [Blastocatellia bacterium]|nr:lipopolysaccharide transport system permease protein [Blastocatellia bacterium]
MPDQVNDWASLPEKPLIKIRVSKRWASIELREIWAHRELLYLLVWRDLKVRYKQTVLGATWVILQPLLMTLVFAVFLGKIARVSSGGVPYVLFLYSGLVPWTFFSNAVSSSSHSLVASAHMITKVYFPRSIVPAAAVLVRLSDFIIASIILVILMLYYRQPLHWAFLLAPLLILNLTLLASALGMWFSALNVKYRDIGTALPVLLQLWMFASPIVYPSSLVPQHWKWVYDLNPLTGIIEGFRASLLGQELNMSSLVASGVITLALLVNSMYAFRRLEDELADIV